MTRLTLHWHLRTIIEGLPEITCTPVAHDDYGFPTEWEYSNDCSDTGSGEYAKTNGCVNTAYDKSLASQALHSSDPVAYLDAVAHDPCVPMDWRFDAEELLSHHIMERRLICSDERRSITDDDGPENETLRTAFIQAQSDGDLPQKSMQSDYWWAVRCPNCQEGECLFDVDRPAEPNRCLGCGTTIPIPDYPA